MPARGLGLGRPGLSQATAALAAPRASWGGRAAGEGIGTPAPRRPPRRAAGTRLRRRECGEAASVASTNWRDAPTTRTRRPACGSNRPRLRQPEALPASRPRRRRPPPTLRRWRRVPELPRASHQQHTVIFTFVTQVISARSLEGGSDPATSGRDAPSTDSAGRLQPFSPIASSTSSAGVLVGLR